MGKFKIKNISPPYQPIHKVESEFDFEQISKLNSLDSSNTSNIVKNNKFYLTSTAWNKITHHIAWGKKTNFNIVEQGGLLLGQVYFDKEQNIIIGVAEEALSADLAIGNSAYLRIGCDAWKKMIDELDQKENEPQIIGWYHTHPNNLSVFMSGTDMKTQRAMFSKEWHFAIVINPHLQIWRAYHGANAKKCTGYILKESK